MRFMFRETEILAELLSSLPVSAAAQERAFSALKRLKTCLRTIKQDRHAL